MGPGGGSGAIGVAAAGAGAVGAVADVALLALVPPLGRLLCECVVVVLGPTPFMRTNCRDDVVLPLTLLLPCCSWVRNLALLANRFHLPTARTMLLKVLKINHKIDNRKVIVEGLPSVPRL